MEKREKGRTLMRALVVRFSAIGDCVMAVPVAAAIREKYPDAHIEWAIEPWCAPVVDTKQLVSRAALFPRDEWESKRWSPATWAHQFRTYFSLRKEKFDIGVDLQGQSKTALCLRIANPAKRIAIRGHDLLSKKLNPLLNMPRGDQHSVEANLMALSHLGDFSKTPRFVMPDLIGEKKSVAPMLHGKVASIAPGTGQAKKTYPLEKWEEVGRQLSREGFTIVWIGAKKDPHPSVEGAIDLIGKLNLAESMAAIKLSAVHLAGDTGSGHIAAAYNVPVVSVFGATPAKVFRPYTDRGIVLEGHGSPATVEPSAMVSAVHRLFKEPSEAISS
jgi:ADP-heptose:LPS heptosyltransferase